MMPGEQESLEQHRENGDERRGLALHSPRPPYPTPRGKARRHLGFTFPSSVWLMVHYNDASVLRNPFPRTGSRLILSGRMGEKSDET